MAFLEGKLEKEKIHGRLAFQMGTSVHANYSSEKRYGAPGGSQLADLTRHVQEAYAGYRIAEGHWVDVGIFFSHIGIEGLISRDNWNYTRSLAADFSPYYQAGARLNSQWSPAWSTSLQVLNGWQNTIETNGDKALGMQVSFVPNDTWSVTYNNFIGRESELRFFNNLILKANPTANWSLAFSSDLGFQKKGPGGGYSTWYAQTLLSRYRLGESLFLGGRLEYFHDKDQVVVTTGTGNGFQTAGASLNLDWQPEPYFLFRNEVRTLISKDAVFSGKSGARSSSTHVVTSVALSF